MARLPGVDRERSILDLEGEPSTIPEDHEHIWDLPVVHRFVVHLHTCLRIVAPYPVADQVLGAQVVPALGRVGDRVDQVAVGEVIPAAATTRDQARILAARHRADEMAGVTLGAQPPGGADVDEDQGCIIRKATITGKELAHFRPSTGAMAGGRREMDGGGCGPAGRIDRQVSHPLARSS